MKRNKDIHLLGILVLVVAVLVGIVKIGGYVYATRMVNKAREGGLYPTAEAAMRQLIADHYTGIQRVTIFYAGPNDSDGFDPHVWYVMAEVHAERRADGGDMGEGGCDAPGTFFLQTHEGWFHVPEGAFPGLLGKWMARYDFAGPGETEPAINMLNNRPYRFCQ